MPACLLDGYADSCQTKVIVRNKAEDVTRHREAKMTVRLPKDLYDRMKLKLLTDDTNFQSKMVDLIEHYVDGPVEDREEIVRQVAIAREAMRRYAPAMRELAR